MLWLVLNAYVSLMFLSILILFHSPVDTFSSSPAATSKTQCLNCDANRTTGNLTSASSQLFCQCKRLQTYQTNDNVCEECPLGSTCPIDGSKLMHIHPKLGFWQADNITQSFVDCGMAFSDIKLAEQARLQCCPTEANCDVVPRSSMWKPNHQCLKGYAGKCWRGC